MVDSAINSPGVGLDIISGEGWCFNRTAATVLSVGDWVQTDDSDSTTATTATGEATPGSVGSMFANVILATTAGVGVGGAVGSFGGLVVAVDGQTLGAVGGLVKVRARGRAAFKATAAVTIGSMVAPQNGVTTLDDTAVVGGRYVAKALVVASGAFSATGVLTPCYVNGIDGIGIAAT